MKIALASDHGGYELKNKLIEHLKEKGYEIEDFGTNSADSCDYPLYAARVAQAVLNKACDRGILCCGTGVGMAIAANRFKGIRAANVTDIYCAKMSREHNDANILTLGERVIAADLAFVITDVWLNAEFQGGRHQKRIDLIDNLNN